METVVEMQYMKTTMRTHVYKNEDDNAAISTLYVNKTALPRVAPESITVKIEQK